MFSRKFVSSVFLAVAFASSTLAIPFPSASKHATHRVRDITPALKLVTFHPESDFEVCGMGFKLSAYLHMLS